MSRNAWNDIEREEIERADQREIAAQERLAAAEWFDEFQRQERLLEQAEREKRALEWAISTGAKP